MAYLPRWCWKALAGIAVFLNVPLGAAPADEAVANRPTGPYEIVVLTLQGGWESGANVPLQIALRDGEAKSVWFRSLELVGGNRRMRADELNVRLKGGRLAGTITGRWVSIWAPMAGIASYTYHLDANLEGEKVRGTFVGAIRRGEDARTVRGQLWGTLRTEQNLRREQALPAGKDWPWYYGMDSAFRGPTCGRVMIDDWGDVRPAWKSEARIPTAWGNAPDGRYSTRAAFTGPAGGASSPVVYGGRIYQYYFVPSGELPADRAEKIRRDVEQFTKHPIERAWMLDFYRPKADDVLVCMDAATGKTLWKTVLPGRGVNIQTHKWRGYNPTPFVADGKVFFGNYARRFYALDAETGRLIWEYAERATESPAADACGPVYAEGVLVVAAGGAVGLDAKTGRELWTGPGGNLVRWIHGGRTYVIAGSRCLDPKTGEALWAMDRDYSQGKTIWPLVSGDNLLGIDRKGGQDAGADLVCYRLSPEGAERIWSLPASMAPGLTVLDGHVYIAAQREAVWCLDLATGKNVGSLKGVGGGCEQLVFSADQRVFIQPEGRHGGQSFWMLHAGPDDFRLMGDRWLPPQGHTTAYANHPMAYPVVDGRLFVRGFDGVYCYDLRVRPLGATKWQTIDFPPLPQVAAGFTRPVELKATATSGLPVEYRVAEGPGRIEGGTVIPTGETGLVAVTASQPGDQTWIEAKPVTRYLAVGRAAPDPPRDLRAMPVSNTRIRLSWADASDDELGFRVYRRGSHGDWRPVAEVDPNATTFTDTNLQPHARYAYRVTAFNEKLESDPSREVDAATYTAAVQYFVEAEATPYGRKWQVRRGQDVSGGVYLEAGDQWKDPQASPPGKDETLRFQVYLPVPGDYRLCGRNLAHGGGANSFLVRVDDGPWHVWAVEEGGWRFTLGHHSSVLLQDLPAGRHTVQVGIREKGTGADKFCLRSESDSLPPPKGFGGEPFQPGKVRTPPSPRNVKASRNSAGQTVLAWKSDDRSAAGFVVERRRGNGEFEPVDVVSAEATNWTDPAPLPAATEYRVRAFGPGGTSGPAP